jgi:hypothetical protein
MSARRLRRYDPTPLIVYSLGLRADSLAALAQLDGVEVRRFDFASHPAHYAMSNEKRGQYAWKASIVADVGRQRGGLVLWLDAGDRIWKRPAHVWRQVAERGAYSTWTQDGMWTWVHPRMLTYFGVRLVRWRMLRAPRPSALQLDPDDDLGEMCNGALLGFNFDDPTAITTILEPVRRHRLQVSKLIHAADQWEACSRKEACIAPEGSDVSNHRQVRRG